MFGTCLVAGAASNWETDHLQWNVANVPLLSNKQTKKKPQVSSFKLICCPIWVVRATAVLLRWIAHESLTLKHLIIEHKQSSLVICKNPSVITQPETVCDTTFNTWITFYPHIQSCAGNMIVHVICTKFYPHVTPGSGTPPSKSHQKSACLLCLALV